MNVEDDNPKMVAVYLEGMTEIFTRPSYESERIEYSNPTCIESDDWRTRLKHRAALAANGILKKQFEAERIYKTLCPYCFKITGQHSEGEIRRCFTSLVGFHTIRAANH